MTSRMKESVAVIGIEKVWVVPVPVPIEIEWRKMGVVFLGLWRHDAAASGVCRIKSDDELSQSAINGGVGDYMGSFLERDLSVT
jgi:hypothetical protein